MATGQHILDKLKKMKEGEAEPAPEPMADGRGMFVMSGVKIGIVSKDAGLIEQLVATGRIVSSVDPIGTSGARFHVALRLRDLFEGAQVRGMKSPTVGDAGGGGAPSSDITGYQLDCLRMVGRVRAAMPKPYMADVLEHAICWDSWHPAAPGDLDYRIKILQCAIDHAGAALHYIPEESVMQRWSHEKWREARQSAPPVRSRIRVARD
ncbi:hypothetical protein [uncultured Pleomorphomonas sp.]|uniref:hypothetical protein n=1 Tax=uncultured Pleomorphomonas sp. TaxID=442121 RepID=UPI00258CB69C|nr:hypothetical protein [uncultured Pleomorphomonas sp.]